MSLLRKGAATQLSAALVGLVVYGLGLGWLVGGRPCGTCLAVPVPR